MHIYYIALAYAGGSLAPLQWIEAAAKTHSTKEGSRISSSAQLFSGELIGFPVNTVFTSLIACLKRTWPFAPFFAEAGSPQ